MERKGFIKRTSIVTAGLLLQNPFSLRSQRKKEEKINIGIIGCGDRGRGIVELLHGMNEKFTITAICDILDLRFTQTRKISTFGTMKEYKDYRGLLDDKEVQAVVIATPLYLHYAMAADALKAGKHVYLEKTMTYSIPEAIKLVKLSRSHVRQVLQIGHQHPYTPLYQKVKDMIEKGYLGVVTQIDCRYDRNGSWRRPVPDPSLEKIVNWRMYKAYSGGLTAEILSHQMQFINWAFNTHPDEIHATGGIDFYRDGRETYDNVQVMLRYKSKNMIGNFGATCANAREGYILKIKGSKGTIELLINEGKYYPEAQAKKELETIDGVTGATKIQWKNGEGSPIMKEPGNEGTWYALQDFHTCVTEKKSPLCDVIVGATAAISVHLANEALYNATAQHWKTEYNFPL